MIGQLQRRQSLLSYLLAILGVAIVALLMRLLPVLITHGTFGLFLIVVTLVTWFGGWRPGLLVICLSILVATMVALPTRHALILDWSDGFRLAVYLLVAGVIATLHASRERARHEAWQTEQRLAFALNHAHMGAWYSDLKSGKFWWSEGMEKLFGRPPGDFSGTYEGFIGYIHPDDQDFVRRAVTRSVEHGQQFEIEHRIVCPNGQTRWILTRGQIIHDEAGKPWQMIGLAMDDTGRKESAAGAAGGTRGAATA